MPSQVRVVDSIPVDIDHRKVIQSREFRRLKGRETEIELMAEKGRGLIRPRAVLTFLEVKGIDKDRIRLGSDHVLESLILSDTLEIGQTIAPYVITIGRELEDEASRMSARDVFGGWALARMGDLALGNASVHVRSLAAQELGDGLSDFAPGTGTGKLFGIKQQAVLFDILNPPGNIGVSLTSSYLMMPIKSISGVFAKVQREYVACQYCPKRCESRRKPFAGEYQRIACKLGESGSAVSSHDALTSRLSKTNSREGPGHRLSRHHLEDQCDDRDYEEPDLEKGHCPLDP